MVITLSQAVQEVKFFIENGGINARNFEHVKRIIDEFGPDTHEIFQEATDQIEVLLAAGVVSGETA